MDGRTRSAATGPRRDRAPSVRRAIPENDPLWQAVKRAPVYDGPVPEQELMDVEAALASGHFTDGATVTREIESRKSR